MLEDSRHACGLKLAGNVEILLHIGIDTVDMQGTVLPILFHLDSR